MLFSAIDQGQIEDSLFFLSLASDVTQHLLGREVRTLQNGLMEAGRHRVVWDGQSNAGRPVASGVYFYRMEAGSFSASETMMVVH